MDSINPDTHSHPQTFTNEVIDTQSLPRFEHVLLRKLEKDYAKVVALRTTVIVFLIIGIPLIIHYNLEKPVPHTWAYALGIICVVLVTILLSIVSYRKKGFAFRQHDVIFRSGIIATQTTIIPFNRVQHVVLHEGAFSRLFGLATIGIYTAGDQIGDLSIPGIAKQEAESIKQLLIGKINTPE